MEAVLKSEDEERAFKKQIFIIKDREKVIVFLYINSILSVVYKMGDNITIGICMLSLTLYKSMNR